MINATAPRIKNKELKIIKDEHKLINYLSDESGLIKGFADGLILAECEEDLINALKFANENKIRLTVSGAGTGITGSRAPLGGLVLSTELFTEVESPLKEGEELIIKEEFGRKYSIIIGKDSEGHYAIAPPGIPLRIFKEMVESKNLFYPPDPTESSSFLGGNVATNASGSRTFGYGSTRDYVRRLRIVLPIAEVLDIKRGMYFEEKGEFEIFLRNKEKIKIKLPSYEMPKVEKNAAGIFVKKSMDFIDLFIGSEGILGIISEIELKLIEKPKIIRSIFVLFEEERKSVDFAIELRKRKEKLKLIALEFFDSNSIEFMKEKYPRELRGFNGLIDIELVAKNEEEEINLFSQIQEIAESFDAKNSLLMDLAKAKEIRHALPEAVNNFVRKHGTHKVASDIAVPEENFNEMYEYYKEIGRESKIRYVLFGHIGNFHLHFNFLPRNNEELERSEKYLLLLWKKAIELKGTLSAEHGVGKKYYIDKDERKPLLELMYGEKALLEISKLKHSLDPNHILNIGNIISEKYLEKIISLE